MNRLFASVLALLILASPAAAFAQYHPAGSAAHMRPVLFHDRSPRLHLHMIQPHH